jgi:hypothetical protein
MDSWIRDHSYGELRETISGYLPQPSKWFIRAKNPYMETDTFVSMEKIDEEDTEKRAYRNTTHYRLWDCWQKTLTIPAPCATTISCISSREAMKTPWNRGERNG